MPDAKEKARRWSGFVCPDCRFVFRVPRDHDGSGLVCPSCRRLLKIPHAGDVTPPLLAPVRSVAVETGATPGAGAAPEVIPEDPPRRRKRSSRNRRKPETHSWEAGAGRRRGSRTMERKHMGLALAAGAVVLILILAAVWGSFRHQLASPEQAGPDGPVALGPAEAASLRMLSDTEFLKLAEPAARAFLTTNDVEELLPLVRRREIAEPRIRARYPDGRIEPEGLNRFNVTAEVNHEGSLYQVYVETRDFEIRPMSFTLEGDGLVIDWEAWVGWSEISWDDLLAEKPTEPKRFRVLLRQAEYYNFGFSDDETWRSFALDSPDREYTVYGYVKRGVMMEDRLRSNPDARQLRFVLDLRFPEESASRNQVIVERIVTEGWAIETPDEP